MENEQDLVYRLLKRAEIRRQISTRKSVQEGQPDRLAELLEEAAAEIAALRELHGGWKKSFITILGEAIRHQEAAEVKEEITEWKHELADSLTEEYSIQNETS